MKKKTRPPLCLLHFNVQSVYMCLGLCAVCEAGQRVMVIGGGLTSAHVISIALQQGASHVTWVMRKHLQVQCDTAYRLYQP